MAATAAHSGSRLRIGDALVALAAAAALVWLVMRVEPLGWSGPPETDIVVDGARYRLDPDGIRELETLSIEYFAAGGRAARTIVASEIDAALDRLFARARQSIPAFLDEYYSLRGEYARAAISLGALVGLAEPGELEARAASVLLPEDEWVDALARVDEAIAGRLDAHRERLRAGWLAEIAARLEAHGKVTTNRFMLRAEIAENGRRYELTLFTDGRAIVKGTREGRVARSVYAKYVGI
ncbi:MAG: hypothetical protein LOD94_06510 [Gammaproteobacteria bacterium]